MHDSSSFEHALAQGIATLGQGDLDQAADAFACAAREGQRGGWRCESERPVALLLDQPWCGYPNVELVAALAERGCLPVVMSPEVALGGALPDVNAENWRTLRHRGVSLRDVAAYDLCVRHERTLAELEAGALALPAIAAEFDRAVRMLDRADAFLEVFTPAVVAIAQGHVLASAALRALAQARGVRVVALENTMHRERLLWDDGAALPVVHNPVRASWWCRSAADPAQDTAYAEAFLRDVRGLKSEEHAGPAQTPSASAVTPVPSAPPAGQTLLYLGQVSTDSAVLWGLSPGFDRQVDVLRSLTAYAADRGLRVRAKLHPKEAGGDNPLELPYDRLTWRQVTADPELSRWMGQGVLEVDADNGWDTYAAIEAADACVTITSQAGLEALLAGREVVLCGRAFYGGLGFTHEADGPETLAGCLDRALRRDGQRNDPATVRAFFRHYLEQQCVAKTPESVADVLCAGLSLVPNEKPEPVGKDFAYESGERQTALRYDEIRYDHRARYEFAAEALRSIGGNRTLEGADVFCGNGYGTRYLAEGSSAKLQGIDGSAEAVAVAADRFAHPRARYDHACFPFALPERSLDFAVSFESVEHVEADTEFVRMLADALRPGGLLFLSTPNEAALPFQTNADYFGHHCRHYTQREIEDLAGLRGLAPRLTLGQDCYRLTGNRVSGLLDEPAMGLRDDLETPQFWVQVYERIGLAEASRADGVRLAGMPLGDLAGLGPGAVGHFASREFADPSERERLTAQLGQVRRALAPGGSVELRLGSGDALPRFSAARAVLLGAGFCDVVGVPGERNELRIAAWQPR
ncbi:MAG: methyltransferase domain-containing protein [Myxococcota bacterium]